MLPIVATLLSNGLSLIANAVIAKGQAVVEKELGVTLDTTSSTTLRELEMKHEEFLMSAAIKKQEMDMEAEKAAQAAVSDRWKADMLSDSWLSKNIRPLVLIYLLGAYTVFSIGSGVSFQITQAYVELLAQMLMLVMGAYFAGRTIEKIVDMKERGKE
jgi:hypothetical protein